MEKLIRLRNPWGNSEWLGEWSESSNVYQRSKHFIQTYINSLPPEEQFPLEADDGTFIMHYDDWKDNFTALYLNMDFPDEWTGVRFKS